MQREASSPSRRVATPALHHTQSRADPEAVTTVDNGTGELLPRMEGPGFLADLTKVPAPAERCMGRSAGVLTPEDSRSSPCWSHVL